MPALFALCSEVFHSPAMASFAAFGSFSMLLLVEFPGTMVQRVRAHLSLGVSWGVLICLGTLVAHRTWLGVAVTVVVGFLVLFSGIVSSVLAGSATALLLAFVLPVTSPAPLSVLPDRLAGAGLATAAAVLAVCLLWPRPSVDPLCAPAARVCRAASARIRAEASRLDHGADAPGAEQCRAAAEQAARAGVDLRRAFDATPYRPTGLSITSRALVRLIDELTWLARVLADTPTSTDDPPPCDPAAPAVRRALADVLDRAAELLEDLRADPERLRLASDGLRAAVVRMERSSTGLLPVRRPTAAARTDVDAFVATLDLSFRAQELGFAVLQIAGNIHLAAAAEQRSWPERLLGREPGALTEPLAAARERAAAHLQPHSVWLHNSLRGAVGLGIAVALADVTAVQHSFWIVLGTLSVLRSSALNTGQNAMRAVLGTVAGSIIGAGLLQLIGHHGTLLWFLLPLAILLAGIAPAAISFTAGQAAFTVTLVVLFNIGHNPDWHIALLRVQDIGLGCGVSVLVALFFWPRGAGAAVERALADAYRESARYLAGAVEYAVGHCTADPAATSAPVPQGREAAASARRLDDAFRSYLAERGSKPMPLANLTALVTGVVGLRLVADAVVSLWRHSAQGRTEVERTDARLEILGAATRVTDWYRGLAAGLDREADIPAPVPTDAAALARLVASVRHDLSDERGQATGTAVRIIWTGDHIDVARRLQPGLAAAARPKGSG
ncbi:FUSC family protein [Streptacidiphilus sp. PB12-B1b]|nr:FUSC family protein [Streptacidiphilus sp. PB12-B1b]